MKAKPGKVSIPRARPTAGSGRTGRGRSGTGGGLSLNDLQIPVQPLLTAAEERHAGRRVRTALSRLRWLLPRHPRGYRRFLARMEEVVVAGGWMFSWLSLREKMAADLEVVTSSLSEAESHLPESPEKARRAFERGVAVLTTYPLDPETLYQWAREVMQTVSRGRTDRIDRDDRSRRIERLLGRTLETLGRERDHLVLPNFRLVLKEVFRYHPTGMRRSDLFQEGVLGLHKAVFRFDPGRATRFSTYATYWIRQSIRKALIDKSRVIRVPQAIQEELRKEEPGLPEQEAARVRRILSETMLFSAGESEEGGDRNAFVVPDGGRSEMGESFRTTTIPAAIAEAVEDLDSREREVVRRRFGLGGDRPQTLEEIGKLLNLSRERIRQIERDALTRMREVAGLQEIYEGLDAAVGPVSTANGN